jgi:hypothetical protein
MARASKDNYTPMHARSDYSLDGSEEDAVPFLHPQSQPPASPSRCSRTYLLLGVVLLVLSNLVSLLIGGFVGLNTVDLDRSCAAHTTQYCTWCSVRLPRRLADQAAQPLSSTTSTSSTC